MLLSVLISLFPIIFVISLSGDIPKGTFLTSEELAV